MTPQNPAEQSAAKAQDQIHACIDRRRSFLVESGAGSGKTHSLIQALRHVIDTRGKELLRRHQLVACITYTNVAVNEIETRTDKHPAVKPSTIHGFAWSLLCNHQAALRAMIPTIGKWPERIHEAGMREIGARRITYDLGHPRIEESQLSLHHGDVLTLLVKMLERPKFRRLVVARYPIIFIDEYQDTDADLASAICAHLLVAENGALIGFFGDHWQKIYEEGCGKIDNDKLHVIVKNSNFRSVPAIVNCLNRLRPDLPQQVSDPTTTGAVSVFHTNAWRGTRQRGAHNAGDLPPDESHGFLNRTRALLEAEGWDFSPQYTKVLMLTHRVLARQMGYSEIVDVFDYPDSYIKKEDAYIKFLCDVIEPACVAYQEKRYGVMFDSLGARAIRRQAALDKVGWVQEFDRLMELRERGTIGDVIAQIRLSNRIQLPERVARMERELAAVEGELPADSELQTPRKLHAVPYRELVSLASYIDQKTPFATKHGVKGAEFQNVLIVFGRGWSRYDFSKFLEMHGGRVTEVAAYERNRNLFYVVCSRPATRLALLFTQQLSDRALEQLRTLFGAENLRPAPSA